MTHLKQRQVIRQYLTNAVSKPIAPREPSFVSIHNARVGRDENRSMLGAPFDPLLSRSEPKRPCVVPSFLKLQHFPARTLGIITHSQHARRSHVTARNNFNNASHIRCCGTIAALCSKACICSVQTRTQTRCKWCRNPVKLNFLSPPEFGPSSKMKTLFACRLPRRSMSRIFGQQRNKTFFDTVSQYKTRDSCGAP